MTNSTNHIFMTWAPILRERGFWPRPVAPGAKVSRVKEWQIPDPELSPHIPEFWTYDFADHGVGLITGSPFPDGTVLGAFHITHDDYAELGKVLPSKPVCGCFGAEGATLFVRVGGDRRGGRHFKIGELLGERRFCVLPPTIDPDTKWPYQWLGTPLHAVDYADLPMIEA